MPLFEYKCRHCESEFECLVLSSQDDEPECPCCHKKGVDKLMSAGSFRPHGIPTGAGGFSLPACAPKGG
ncbi:MAG: zinc ribbon domain-containing protein [Desulfobacterales bacterium]|jgi:putative FmdB family regulatory protein